MFYITSPAGEKEANFPLLSKLVWAKNTTVFTSFLEPSMRHFDRLVSVIYILSDVTELAVSMQRTSYLIRKQNFSSKQLLKL
jgi:hypothetical protein